MSDTRESIESRIHIQPGIHFNELVRVLDLAPGQVQYHLRRLLSAETVVEERRYGRTHYYSPTYDDWERGALALLRRETARDVVTTLVESEPARPDAVAAELGIARSTLEWHLDHLVEQGLATKHRDERNHVTVTLTRPQATVELLCELDPSTPERMVDRFVRLTDGLLDGVE